MWMNLKYYNILQILTYYVKNTIITNMLKIIYKILLYDQVFIIDLGIGFLKMYDIFPI